MTDRRIVAHAAGPLEAAGRLRIGLVVGLATANVRLRRSSLTAEELYRRFLQRRASARRALTRIGGVH